MNEHELSASERVIRKGELRQLKDLKRAHRYEAPRKRKLKKMDVWNADDGEDADDGKVDIRDVDFRLSHDASKIDVNISGLTFITLYKLDNRIFSLFIRIQSLVSGATACSYRDLVTLKLILVSGLYPQVAISDEFNHLKVFAFRQ